VGCVRSKQQQNTRLDNLGDIRVIAVVVVVVLKLTVIVEVVHTGLSVDEILNLMCPLDL
jgi:hypothetical protein